jgi:tRNA-2-methylthio-N6-dimethylallyladenosine synthase
MSAVSIPSSAKTFRVVTWGCQMNVEDSEQMERYLRDLGYVDAADESADVVLLNTCSVRKKPEDKAFSMLGVLREAKEAKPEMVIGVCGCMAQLRADEIRKRAPHVDFVIGTAEISKIPALVSETMQARRFRSRTSLPERKGSVVTDIPQRHLGVRTAALKSFVPIQYGCDKFCTFCIVPTTRGRERSRSTEDILEEVALLAARGTKEITLLGQTVNSYGKNLMEGKVPFARLLREIADIAGIERIRYTSPYPRDFRGDLISVHRDIREVMPHCHLPLQSGDDEVLKEMHRVYTVESFTEIYRNLRSVPGMAVTTDVIVGFPGESEEQFRNTMKVMESLRFDGAFMFAYSPRPDTPAAAMHQVDAATKKRRLNELIDLQNAITCEINHGEAGSVFEVMVEGPSEKDPRLLKGLTRHFKTMHFPGAARPGDIINVVAEEPHLWGFYGRVV